MGKIEEYLDRAKDLAEDAGDIAKKFAGEAVNKAKELTEDGSKVRELAKDAKTQASAISLGAREKVQGFMQDARAGKEIKQGITELENLPELEGSILYTMELESMKNDLNSLLLIINDSRLDDASVVEEVKKVMAKAQPAASAAPAAEAAPSDIPQTDEDLAIHKVKVIAFSACTRALEALQAAGATW
ncbi:MAG: hypothetical protein IJI11_06890 [Mogibacterium sp.]|nr:hypothetical protein [Mogibacterium sp.]